MVKKKSSTKKLDVTADYKMIFGSDAGQRVLWDIMRSSFVLDTTFCVTNEYETILREGSRNCALRIMSILQTDEKQLMDQIKEGFEYDREYADEF